MYADDVAIYDWDPHQMRNLEEPAIKIANIPELGLLAHGKIQNAFGVYRESYYFCQYNPLTNQVTYFEWEPHWVAP